MEGCDRPSLAPLVSLSAVAPSLDSMYSKTPHTQEVDIEIGQPKTEVKFTTGTNSSSASSSSSSSSSVEDEVKPKIPDGGYGWVVVFASLILSMIADGISFSFGLLYVELVNEFGASNSETSWIGSLFLAVPLITGPIMSALVDKFGCRSMTILGGIIAALGFFISSLARSILIMNLTFGVLAGLGLGLCYVTAVVSIAFWFDKRRTLAVGLGAAGTGIGTFVFSPFTTFLIYEYTWRGTTLLLAGVLLNMCVCGALMRDPDWIIEQNKQNRMKSEKSSKTSLMSVSSAYGPSSIDINEIRSLLKSGKDAEYLLQNLETSMQSAADKTKLKSYFHSVLNLPTFVKQNEKVPVEVLELLSSNKRLYNIILENYPSLILCRSTSDRGLNKMDDNTLTDRVPVTFCMKLKKQEKDEKEKLPPIRQESLPEDSVLEAKEPLISPARNMAESKRNQSYPRLKHQLSQAQKPNYYKNMKFHRQSLIHRGAIFSTHKYKFKASSCPNIYKVSMMTLSKEYEETWYSEAARIVKSMFGYTLFLELHFLLMSLSTIILFFWFIIPYFFLAGLMSDYDYTTEQASFTISVIGIANTIGMVLLGWAGDQPWMDITKTYAICLILCGIACAGFMYFITNYIMLEISAALFGLFLSSTFSFTPGILMELLPLERFTIAYGLQLLCMGIGILLGPPYAGHLYDVTQSWEAPFYKSSAWIIISGLFIAAIPYCKNKKIIGSGDVEKVDEDAENKMFMLAIISFTTVVFIVYEIYDNVRCLTQVVSEE